MSAKVLLIDDNEQNRYLVSCLLEKSGFELFIATTGAAALAIAPGVCPDLILLDVQLPDADGYEVVSQLRSIPDIRDTPIIAVSSFGEVDDIQKALAAGCTGFIEKPVDPDTFVDQVHAAMLTQMNE